MRIIPALLWTLFIVYALTAEPSAIPEYRWFAFSGADKLVHVTLFGTEAFLLSWGLGGQSLIRLFIYILLWSFVLGGGLELIQHNYIEGRSGDLLDLLADVVGGLLGAFGFFIMSYVQKTITALWNRSNSRIGFLYCEKN